MIMREMFFKQFVTVYVQFKFQCRTVNLHKTVNNFFESYLFFKKLSPTQPHKTMMRRRLTWHYGINEMFYTLINWEKRSVREILHSHKELNGIDLLSKFTLKMLFTSTEQAHEWFREKNVIFDNGLLGKFCCN